MTASGENIREVSSVVELQQQMNAQDLPVILCSDEDFDDTVADFSDPETVTLTQIDEMGVEHTIVLSAKIIMQLHPTLLVWKKNSETDNQHDDLKS